MSTATQLTATVPADAVQIIAQIVGKMSMSGLTGHEAAALLQAISTVADALTAEPDPPKDD